MRVRNPGITRKGVKNYKIERIVCDKTGKNLVFIVEKTMEDKTGINIRYMIETARLNDEFFTNLAEPEENAEEIFDSDESAKDSAEETSVSSESSDPYIDAK